MSQYKVALRSDSPHHESIVKLQEIFPDWSLDGKLACLFPKMHSNFIIKTCGPPSRMPTTTFRRLLLASQMVNALHLTRCHFLARPTKQVELSSGGLFRVKRTRNRSKILLQRTLSPPVASRVLEEAVVVEEVVLAVVVPQPVVAAALPAADASVIIPIPLVLVSPQLQTALPRFLSRLLLRNRQTLPSTRPTSTATKTALQTVGSITRPLNMK